MKSNVFWISLLYGIGVVTSNLPQKDSADSFSLRSEMNVIKGGKAISPKTSGDASKSPKVAGKASKSPKVSGKATKVPKGQKN